MPALRGVADEHGVPLVLTLHGYPLFESLSEGYTTQSAAGRRYLMRAEMRALRLADAIVTVDTRLHQHVLKLVPERAADAVALMNFIDTSAFYPSREGRDELRAKWGIPADRTVLFCPRRLVKKNGVTSPSLALAAMTPEERGRFLLLHAGDGGEREAIEAIVREQGLEDQVRLLGGQGRDAVLELYRLCDIVLVPSVHSENVEEATSLAALEAMASGRPLIAGAVGGLAEMVEDGVTGLLVPGGDTAALAAAILRLAAAPDLGDRLAEHARRYVVANHSHLQAAASYVQVYEQAVSAGAGPAGGPGRAGLGFVRSRAGRIPSPVRRDVLGAQLRRPRALRLHLRARAARPRGDAGSGRRLGARRCPAESRGRPGAVDVASRYRRNGGLLQPGAGHESSEEPSRGRGASGRRSALSGRCGRGVGGVAPGCGRAGDGSRASNWRRRCWMPPHGKGLASTSSAPPREWPKRRPRPCDASSGTLWCVVTHHGYFPADPEEEAGVAAAVRESGAAILLVAMGAPRQEIFMFQHRDELGVAVALGVGGSFDVWAGRVARAPEWTQRVKVEWLYRLARDPRRVRRQLALPRFVAQGPRGLARRLRSRSGRAVSRRHRRTSPRAVERMRYLISGYYGEGNAGDEALLAGIIQELRRRDPSADITVLSFDPQDTISPASGRIDLHEPASPRSSGCAPCARLTCSSAAEEASCTRPISRCTVARSFCARAKLRPVPYFLSVVLLAQSLRLPVMWYAQGLGPLQTWQARRLVALAGSGCAAVTWRDPASARLAYHVGVRAPIQSVVPDPAYALAPRSAVRVRELMLAQGIRPERRFMAVCPRPWLGRTEYVQRMAAALGRVAEAEELDVVLVPFQQRTDGPLCASLAAHPALAGARRRLVRHRRCRFAGRRARPGGLRGHHAPARRHSGGGRGTPAVILDYDPKVRAFAEQTGQAAFAVSVDDLESAVGERALEVAATVTARDLDARRAALGRAVAPLREGAGRTARLAVQLASRGGVPGMSARGRRRGGTHVVNGGPTSGPEESEAADLVADSVRLDLGPD